MTRINQNDLSLNFNAISYYLLPIFVQSLVGKSGGLADWTATVLFKLTELKIVALEFNLIQLATQPNFAQGIDHT